MTRRHLDERLALAAPGLTRLLRRLLFRLPPGSALRRRILKRFAVRGWDAFARGDDKAALMTFDGGYELNLIGDRFRALGFAERYQAQAGYSEFSDAWRSAWASMEYGVEQLFDLGDRIVLRFTSTSRGLTSGAEVENTAGSVYFIRDGTIVRQDFYYDWADCAAALGL